MRFFKKIFPVMFMVTFVFIFSSNAADVAKIGVVDIEKIINISNAGKAALAELHKQGEKMKAELEKRKAELEKMKKSLERQAAVMSKEAREEKKRELQIKIYDLKNLTNKYNSEIKKSEKEKIIKLKKEVFNITREIGKKEGYLIIIEKSVAVYVPKTLDLTDKVIQEYNAGFKK
ncbi:MAG: OmpH family outer membrane protein [Thermodesulfobacteriota bacterium]|nr:OmpH family outer membrane protein [Thermodesulfobacteriota bacterium]